VIFDGPGPDQSGLLYIWGPIADLVDHQSGLLH
jgi:hypothetical protein